MKQPIFGKKNTGTGAGTTQHSIWGENPVSEDVSWLLTGNFRKWRVRLSAAVSAASTITFTLRINGSTTGMTITFNPGDTDLTYTGSDVSVTAGDLVNVQIANTGSGGGSAITWCMEFEPSSGSKSIYGGNFGNGSGSTPLYFPPLAHHGTPGIGTIQDQATCVVSAAGTITDFAICMNSAPGGGSHEYALWLNGTKQDGTGGTQDTRISYTGGGNRNRTVSFSLAVSPGDVLYVKYERLSGGSINVYGAASVVFDPTTTGQFMVCGISRGLLQTSAGPYYFGGAHGVTGGNGGSPPTGVGVMGPITTVTLSNFRVWLSAAPTSTHSRTFTWTKGESTSNIGGTPSVAISGANTSGSDGSNTFTLGDDELFEVKETIAGSPTDAYGAWSLIGVEGGASSSPVARARVISWGWG